MQIVIFRRSSKSFGRPILGDLFINNIHHCYTKERPCRKDKIYVATESALPAGLYNVSWDRQEGGFAPLACSVNPVRDHSSKIVAPRIGARFSVGSRAYDTNADIQLGQEISGLDLLRTHLAYKAFIEQIDAARLHGEAIDLDITYA